MAEAVARDRVRDPVECTDWDNDLVMHMGKDMDVFQLEEISTYMYGRVDSQKQIHATATSSPTDLHFSRAYNGYTWCVLCLEVSEEPAHHGGAQLVAEEPNPTELPVKMEFLNLIEKRTVFVYHAEGVKKKDDRMADLNTMKSRTEFEEQKRLAWDLQNRIEDVMFQNVVDGHKLSLAINVGNSLAFILKCALWSSAIILLVLAMVVVDLMLEALYPDVYRNVHEYGMGIDIAKV
ncbi:hypothetical protein Syun_012102 [Stephania yunnanensis]|uniref:Uncharacterized protein n=1 Tax=Stephania yunnanensis TaxID=152371 RepID=A0AAP0PG42_9MAGN